MFCDLFLTYMNNLIFSEFDITNILTELAEVNGGDTEEHYNETGITAMDAYNQTHVIFKDLLNHIKREIEKEFPLGNIV